MLDDVFGFTDDARLGRILQLLAERTGRMQFILLTCHPERYRHWSAAEWLQLEQCRVLAGATA